MCYRSTPVMTVVFRCIVTVYIWTSVASVDIPNIRNTSSEETEKF